MTIPDHLRRHSTRQAIDALAARFDLPNHPGMQDWEWEVADPSRLDEFIAAYEAGGLSEDERFTLMETIIQSFEDGDQAPERDPRWAHVLGLLDRNVGLHGPSIWYWSAPENDARRETFRVSLTIRDVLAKHRAWLQR
ncbi:hypothetical protein FBZ89_103219 [Nitrospirillum amazonense]|uniref:Uncharacterized protein n=1 Tax=Nitrospirillum amazonense TaxID=28077 RepID=A0A560FLV2_9PROT|nr:hypothetical protein [Nitrospirillum amazonense]TWB22596.1 hypothetical protein FBZ89_103219 [Nitrospirillum amazonense]